MLTPDVRESQPTADISPVEKLFALVREDMLATDKLIHTRMGSTVVLIPDLAKHLIDSGGKRLRPLLTLAAAEMGGYKGTRHINLAAAVEFLHNATLLHDDVVDGSDLRRGKVAANIVWGNKSSVLVGDFLISRAFRMMIETERQDILDVLANASSIIAEGEVMQLQYTGSLSAGESHYLQVISAKTAELFAAAAETGAMLANISDAYRTAMRSYGRSLGIAFQLVDDALDYSGRQAMMGKSVGDDFREGKVTMPVILAFARATGEDHDFWERVIETGQQGEADLEHAITLVERSGAIAGTVAKARAYADQAKAALSEVPDCPIKEELARVADFCVDRAY